MCLLGRAQTLDWWENGRGFNASSTAPWCQNYPACQRPGKYDLKLKPWGDQNIYGTLVLSPNSFSGGNTICRMLALQKEIGLGRGERWKWTEQFGVWGFVCGTDSVASGPTGALWCGRHLYRQVYFAQRSELKLSWASLSRLPIQWRLPFLTWAMQCADEGGRGGCFWWGVFHLSWTRTPTERCACRSPQLPYNSKS